MSYSQLQEHVRLFMVPGMHHCVGGPGPNFFDTLAPLDNWVDRGVQPDAIVALHFQGDIPINPPPAPPGPAVVDQTIPLLKLPETARYSGTGDVNSPADRTCPAN